MIQNLQHTDEQILIKCFVGSKPRQLNRKYKLTKTNISQSRAPQHVDNENIPQQVGDYLIETPDLEKTLLKKADLQQKR